MYFNFKILFLVIQFMDNIEKNNLKDLQELNKELKILLEKIADANDKLGAFKEILLREIQKKRKQLEETITADPKATAEEAINFLRELEKGLVVFVNQQMSAETRGNDV